MANAYTDQELEKLQKLQDIRDGMIDDMCKEGLSSSRDRRLMNELLTASENNIHNTVDKRLKHQENVNKEALAEQVAMILLQTGKSLSNHNSNIHTRSLELEDKYVPVDSVPGEKEINPEPLSLEEFSSSPDRGV